MQGKGIAILTQDHCEDPELWEILWRAVLAPEDQPGAKSCRPGLYRRERIADSPTGHKIAQSSRVRMNDASDH